MKPPVENRSIYGNYCVAFSPDGRLRASASPDNVVRLWNVDNGNHLGAAVGHGSDVYCVAFSPDGKTLASGSADDTIKLWDVAAVLKQSTKKKSPP